MAKKEAQELSNNELVEVPDYLKNYDFDNSAGEAYGGSSEILGLEENESAGPLTYVGCRKNVDLGNGMGAVDIHEAKDKENETWRLPIASNFRRQAEAADLARGDIFAVKRIANAVKKHGKGKGNAMEMYVIKVITKQPRQPGPAVV